MASVRKFLRDSRAAAAAEMVLILPLLITLMFGGLEAGNYFWSAHKVVKAVRDGARFAGRQSFDSFDCATGAPTAGAAIAIRNVTRTGTRNGSGPPIISTWADDDGEVVITVSCETNATATGASPTAAGPTFSTTTGLFEGDAAVKIVRVAADTTYPSLFSELGFSASNIQLRASSQAVVMGL